MKKAVVLIVEDEALIRMDAVQSVEDAGFAAVQACNADEAIGILETRNDICAVFTDVRMSGSIDGLKLAHAIRGRWPPIHLIVTSGSNVPCGDKLPENARFIRKPYEARHIAEALHELMGGNLAPLNDNGHNCNKAA